MSTWEFTKGWHSLGNGLFAYLLPDGNWGWSNAGLIADGGQGLLVDTLYDLKLTATMLDGVKDLVPSGIRINTVVNTHGDGDHIWGNELVEGAEIIATQATADSMGAGDPAFFHEFVANADKYGRGAQFMAELFRPFDFTGISVTKPTRIFSGEVELKVGKKSVHLLEVGPAHTAGDAIVFVPEDKVLFTGDILFNDSTPVSWAGPVSRWLAVCDRILGMDVDVIVPGHGAIADKQAMRNMRDYLQFVSEEARKRFDRGMGALEAAFDIDLGRYLKWGGAERIVVTVRTLYEDFKGERTKPDMLAVFEQMASMRDQQHQRRQASSQV